jgi:DNA-binding transcriptional ArsR family regulator
MRYEGSSADLDRTLMALADPVRRRILQRLATSEARITDVASEFPISLNSVSKHIRLLERARLVERTVSGREHILRFRPEPLSEAEQWIAAQQAFWASRLQAIDDLLTAEDAENEILFPKEKKRAEKR